MAADLSSTFQTLTRPNAVDDIVDVFKQAIIRGDLHPGQRLPSEAELREQLGVGRGTVREAMKMLEALGVVDIKRGDGTYIVDKPSSALLSPLVFAIMLEAGMGSELLELRSIIEVGYCQLAAEKATPEDWQRIETAQLAFEDYARSPDWQVDELARRDLDFHYAILDATHNPLLIKIGRTVEELFFASMRGTLLKIFDTAHNVEHSINIHCHLMDTLRQGDLQAISDSVNESLSVVELHLPVEQAEKEIVAEK